MLDIEKVIKGLEQFKADFKPFCGNGSDWARVDDALALLREQEKDIKALRLLVEWAEECDFGFDQFHDEYERYKGEIKNMKYIDGMIHVAKRTLDESRKVKEETNDERNA